MFIDVVYENIERALYITFISFPVNKSWDISEVIKFSYWENIFPLYEKKKC